MTKMSSVGAILLGSLMYFIAPSVAHAHSMA